MKKLSTLGEYKSIYSGLDDELEQYMFHQELRKDHSRPIPVMRKKAKTNAFKQRVKWAITDSLVGFAVAGFCALLVMVIIVAYL